VRSLYCSCLAPNSAVQKKKTLHPYRPNPNCIRKENGVKAETMTLHFPLFLQPKENTNLFSQHPLCSFLLGLFESGLQVLLLGKNKKTSRRNMLIEYNGTWRRLQNDLLTFGLLGTRIDAAVTTPNEPSDPINSCLRSNPRKTKIQGFIAELILTDRNTENLNV